MKPAGIEKVLVAFEAAQFKPDDQGRQHRQWDQQF